MSNISNVKKALGSQALGIGISVGASVIGDVIDKKPVNTVFNNAMTELMFGVAGVAVGAAVSNFITLGTYAGIAMCCSLNPIVAGAVATVAFGIIVDFVPIGGMTLKDRAKEYFYGV